MRKLIVICIISLMPSFVGAETLDGLWGDFRAAIGEQKVSTSSVDDTTITRWVNEGMFWVASRLEPLEKDTAVLVSDSFFTITMPPTFKSMRGVISPSQGALIKTTPDNYGIIKDTGYGTWFANGRKIEINAKDLETDVDSVRFYFYARPPKVAISTDSIEIDDLYHYLIIDFAISRFELSRHFVQSSLAIRQLAGSDLEKARESRITVVKSE